MFSSMKAIWQQTEITTSIEGILREVKLGNATEAQKWYFKLKKDCNKQANEKGKSPKQIEDDALATLPLSEVSEYSKITDKLRQPGGIFAEIDDWMRAN